MPAINTMPTTIAKSASSLRHGPLVVSFISARTAQRRGVPSILECEFHADKQGAFARKFQIVIQRLELIIGVREVQDTAAQFALVAVKSPAGDRVQLPETVARSGILSGMGRVPRKAIVLLVE